MSVTTLLTIHSIDEAADAIQPFVALAGDIGAHLDIIVLGVVKSIPTANYPGLPDYSMADEYSRIIKSADERAKALDAMIAQSGVSASVTIECCSRGMVGHTVSRHAMIADVTVLANGGVPEDALATEAFNGVIFESGQPVVVLGRSSTPFTQARRVLMAWNGEPEAASAIHLALPMLETMEEVHLVLVDPDGGGTTANPGDAMALFLARRGLKVTVDVIASAGRDVSDVLLQHALYKDADLIVMGAYGRSRLREWLLGGTTRTMLEKATIPLLMAH
ncbi:universal stress protein [Hoeflea sp. WL0058]|uniref:Universal stress protein n=1 Tax=Flavimaribacter sediminis TaxID=2865987 RepID=A0AAE3CZT5_9HYPH|nr:universal stress protein [Flavimaribacter sediminis]MBW8636262.1 universal stress protein [Flavimaribacter sediminis]